MQECQPIQPQEKPDPEASKKNEQESQDRMAQHQERRERALNILQAAHGGEEITDFSNFPAIPEDQIMSNHSLKEIYSLLKSRSDGGIFCVRIFFLILFI